MRDWVVHSADPVTFACDHCKSKQASIVRRNTQYTDEWANWGTLCPECADADYAYWAEMWKEYYGGLL